MSLVVLRREEGSVRLRGWKTGAWLWELLAPPSTPPLQPAHPGLHILHREEMSGGGKGEKILPLPWLLFFSLNKCLRHFCLRPAVYLAIFRSLGNARHGRGVRPLTLGITRPAHGQRKCALNSPDIVKMPGYNQGQMIVSPTRYRSELCQLDESRKALRGEVCVRIDLGQG